MRADLWWNKPHSRRFNLTRIGLLTAGLTVLFVYEPVVLWVLIALCSTWYTGGNLLRSIRSRRTTLDDFNSQPPKATRLQVYWSGVRLDSETMIGVASIAALGAGLFALLFLWEAPRPMTITFSRLILPGFLTIIHLSIATYSWIIHHGYHAAVQIIQDELLQKQKLQREVEKLKKENGYHES